MALKTRIEFLLGTVRKNTGNGNVDGILDDEFLTYFNDAQERLQSLIVSSHPSTFLKTAKIDVVKNQTEYDLPVDIFMEGRVFSLERKEYQSTDDNGYGVIDQVSIKARPLMYGYYVEGSKFNITIRPTANITDGYRLTYTRELKDLAIRRGQITSLAPLTVNIATVPTNSAYDVDYLTIVDKDGVQKVTTIENGGYASGTGVITTTTDVTAAAIGDYVIYGNNSTTHSELPKTCERYLREYCGWRIFHRDSRVDFSDAGTVFGSLETDIVDLFAESNDDTKFVPIIDTSYLNF